MSNDNLNIRYVCVREVSYLRAEDVIEYLRECGSGEETDVRNRFKKAANSMCAKFNLHHLIER